MKPIDAVVGVLVGIAAYYTLSLTSAFWLAGFEHNGYLTAALFGGIAGLGLGVMIGWRPSATLTAAGTILVVGTVGYFLGSDMAVWAPPFPLDLWSLLLHGARTPVMPLVAALLVASGVVSTVTRRGSRVRGTAAIDEQKAEGVGPESASVR